MRVCRRALALSFVLWAGLTSFSTANAAEAKKPLSLGFMPYLNAELLVEKYTPLASYLSTKLDRNVKIEVAKNYAEHITATGEDQLDISFLGGSPYVVIGDQYGVKPLLARYEFDGKPTFRAVIFVYKDSPLKDLSELKGKTMAFGSPKSTLSTQVPLYMMMQAGAGLDQLASHKHLRNHSNVVLGVEIGDFDAGAVAEEVFNEHKSNPIRVLAYSPDLSTHVFVARSNMDAGLKDQIATALQDLKTEPGGKDILGAIGPTLTGFVPVQDSDYDLHRTILKDVLPVLEP